MNRLLNKCCSIVIGLMGLAPLHSLAQNTYYIDGFHGGVWGHYPDWNTRFMVDMLKAHPYWNINLEIEPETWQRAAKIDSVAYNELKSMMSGPGYTGRIEYVNPAYAQSYLFNIDGESIIRQFKYGTQMLKADFPGIQFTSYSSEEPCFTSALPQILKSFGIKYASLKNPNTCFGGYTMAHGGELVNWQGPDGSTILTVPRYEVESLSPKSTWQTIAWNNPKEYIDAAFRYGIHHPIGMTLQDAGWKGGPFLGGGTEQRTKNQYVTWREYFDLVKNDAHPVWQVSQEDINVSLVWGSQITQRIAQQVRHAENKLLQTEKLLAINNILTNQAWPQQAIDSAWRTLLLSQHHDCWIVPYNMGRGTTWAQKVLAWTNHSVSIADSLSNTIAHSGAKDNLNITVYNTQLHPRTSIVEVPIPVDSKYQAVSVMDEKGKVIPAQVGVDSLGNKVLVFNASVAAFGYNRFKISKSDNKPLAGTKIVKLKNGLYQLETDQYSIVLDIHKGGTIKSLYAKQLKKEFVSTEKGMAFNMLRGNFYDNGGFKTSADSSADLKIIENGPVRIKIALNGKINGTAWHQVITVAQSQPIIDFDLTLDWKQNTGIGEATLKGSYDWKNYHKPFYDDRNKLLALFPLNLQNQKVFKNAPFDVTESRLKNTFFNSWDSIKNNVLLNWADVTDGAEKYGVALFTDHTTSYAHGEDFPLGLNIQYSGMGLWGRNYTIDGPTHVHYALLPHSGNWQQARIWTASAQWNGPLVAVFSDKDNALFKSLLSDPTGELSLTTAEAGKDNLLIRIFNAEGKTGLHTIKTNFDFATAHIETLDGRELEILKPLRGSRDVKFDIPHFGIRTIRLMGVKN